MFCSIESDIRFAHEKEREYFQGDLAVWTWGYRKAWAALMANRREKTPLGKNEESNKLYALLRGLTCGDWEDHQARRGRPVKNPLQDPVLRRKGCFTAYQVGDMISKATGEYTKGIELAKSQGLDREAKKARREERVHDLQKELVELRASSSNPKKIQATKREIQAQRERIEQLESVQNRMKKVKGQAGGDGPVKVCFGSREKLNKISRLEKELGAGLFLPKEAAALREELGEIKAEWTEQREGWRFSNGDASDPKGEGNKEISWNGGVKKEEKEEKEGIREVNRLRYRWTEWTALRRMKDMFSNPVERAKIPKIRAMGQACGWEGKSVLTASLRDQDIERLMVKALDIQKVPYGMFRQQAVWSVFPMEFHRGKKKSWLRDELLKAYARKQPVSCQVFLRKDRHGQSVLKVQLAYDVQLEELDSTVLREGRVLGLDLNVKGVGYAVCGPQGQLLSSRVEGIQDSEEPRGTGLNPQGFWEWDLSGTSEQRQEEWNRMLGKIEALRAVYHFASVAVEKLEFSRLRHEMKTQKRAVSAKQDKARKKYHHAISTFGEKQMRVRLERWCPKKGLQLRVINPKYSSIGGFTKYGFARGWGIDVSAAYWIARQGALGWRSLDQDVEVKQAKRVANTTAMAGQTGYKGSHKPFEVTKKACVNLLWSKESVPQNLRAWGNGRWQGNGMKNLSTDIERAFRRKKPISKEASEEEKAWNLLYEDLGPRTGWLVKLKKLKHPGGPPPGRELRKSQPLRPPCHRPTKQLGLLRAPVVEGRKTSSGHVNLSASQRMFWNF